MALKTRSDLFGELKTGIQTQRLYQTSRLVSRLTGMTLQRNKAIVGANAFAHESGIHQDGMLKERSTYEIMRPQDVGIDGTNLVLGKHSGRHAFADRMEKLGFRLTKEEVQNAYERFIALADKKKNVYDDDLFIIGSEGVDENTTDVYLLQYLSVSNGTSTIPTATVRLRKGDQLLEDAACGDGPVDAALRSIDRMTGVHGKLEDYSLQSITVGKDAIGEVSVRVAFGDRRLSAKASSTDIVEASVKAYLSCVNRLLSEDKNLKESSVANP